jgi:hypothetical protein
MDLKREWRESTKKSDHEIDLRAHTLKVCKEVYEPLLDIIIGNNPDALYEIQFKVKNRLNQEGDPSRSLIPVEELPDLDLGREHLRTHKDYQGAYKLWEEARTLGDSFNEKHGELNQVIKRMVVDKATEYLPSFSEYESARSAVLQDYFSSEGFLKCIQKEIQGMMKDPKLKPDHQMEFFTIEEVLDKNGRWWSLVRWYSNLLLSRRPSFNNQEQNSVRRILTEIESDPKIIQTTNELLKLDLEVRVKVRLFNEQLKPIVDMINDKQFTNILQGNCSLCR